MSAARHSGSLAMLMVLTACVTINVYFPAAAAEQAADRIIEDVWGPAVAPAPDQPATQIDGRFKQHRDRLAGLILDFIIPTAQAQANLNVSTPAVKKLEGRMQKRFGQLGPYFDSGAVGLTRNGLLAVRNLKSVPAKQRGKVKQLVAADNKDRKALYKEIAVANDHPEWEQDIRDTFARRWIANAKAGWWYQSAQGDWAQR